MFRHFKAEVASHYFTLTHACILIFSGIPCVFLHGSVEIFSGLPGSFTSAYRIGSDSLSFTGKAPSHLTFRGSFPDWVSVRHGLISRALRGDRVEFAALFPTSTHQWCGLKAGNRRRLRWRLSATTTSSRHDADLDDKCVKYSMLVCRPNTKSLRTPRCAVGSFVLSSVTVYCKNCTRY